MTQRCVTGPIRTIALCCLNFQLPQHLAWESRLFTSRVFDAVRLMRTMSHLRDSAEEKADKSTVVCVAVIAAMEKL